MKNMSCIITGGTRNGIGGTTALILASKGASLTLTYKPSSNAIDDEERLSNLSKYINTFGGNVTFYSKDLSKEENVEELINLVINTYGKIDVLINNSGSTWLETNFEELDLLRWQKNITYDLNSFFLITKQVYAYMNKKTSGRIININLDEKSFNLLLENKYSSLMEKNAFSFIVSKNARTKLSELISLSAFGNGISINNINPGIIEEIPIMNVIDYLSGKGKSIFYSPIDVAECIAFLCSDLAKGISGSEIVFPGNLFSRLQ